MGVRAGHKCSVAFWLSPLTCLPSCPKMPCTDKGWAGRPLEELPALPGRKEGSAMRRV